MISFSYLKKKKKKMKDNDKVHKKIFQFSMKIRWSFRSWGFKSLYPQKKENTNEVRDFFFKTKKKFFLILLFIWNKYKNFSLCEAVFLKLKNSKLSSIFINEKKKELKKNQRKENSPSFFFLFVKIIQKVPKNEKFQNKFFFSKDF